MKRFIAVATLILAMSAVAVARDAIVELDVKPGQSVFKESSWNKPLVLNSKEDAAKHFGEEALKALTEKVDFEKQIVLVFAWRGSGQDKMQYAVKESFPEQIVFARKRGMTRDLRPHTKVFALRSNVRWSVNGGRPKIKK